MYKIRLFCLLILIFILYAASSASAEADRVVLEVIVNGQNIGQQVLLLAPDDDVRVSPEFLKMLRLREEFRPVPDKEIQGQKISLRSLAPFLQFQIDHSNAALTIAVSPDCFESTVIEKPSPPSASAENDHFLHPRPFAAFLNYRIQADYSEEDSFHTCSLPAELGVNWKKIFAFSSFQARFSDEDEDFSRLMTHLTWDDPEQMQRLIFGDFNAPSTDLLGGGLYGGISWSTRFSMNRDFKPFPGLNTATVIETPTHAELRRGGHIIKEWELLPGPVLFSDLESYGAGDGQLLLRDIYGRERILDLPTLLNGQDLLREGVHEFSYNIGFPREDFGQSDNSYGDIAALGFHRYGFTDRITAGFIFACQEDFFSIGPTLGFRLGKYHSSELETLYSNNEGESGYGLSFRHNFRWKDFSAWLSLREYSRNFSTPTLKNSGQENRQQYMRNLSISYTPPHIGGFSFSYSTYRTWEEDPGARLTLTYNKNIFKRISMSFTLRHGIQGEEEDEIGLSFHYTPGSEKEKKIFDSAAYRLRDTEEKDMEHELSIQKNAGSGKGFGYNMTISHHDGKSGGSVRADYRHERGILSASCTRSPGSDTTNGFLSGAGGMGLLDGGLYFGRPVIDSFAVVKVEGLDDVPVYSNGSLAGVLDNGETLLVPNLNSYQENRIEIHPADLPVSFELENRKYDIKIAQSGGAGADFRGYRYRAVEGNLYLLSTDGKKEYLSTLPLETEVNGEKRRAFSGREGYFYLENLPPGEYVLKVLRADGDCKARLIVAESDKIVSSLGEVICKPDE